MEKAKGNEGGNHYSLLFTAKSRNTTRRIEIANFDRLIFLIYRVVGPRNVIIPDSQFFSQSNIYENTVSNCRLDENVKIFQFASKNKEYYCPTKPKRLESVTRCEKPTLRGKGVKNLFSTKYDRKLSSHFCFLFFPS